MQQRQGAVHLGRAALGLALALVPAAALGAAYEFAPAPQTDLNRVYRIDRATGEVTACQYGLQEGSVGATLCFGPGEGANHQVPGDYSLVASRHEREGGVFRVNLRSGEMSICYVFESKVVCTPQTNPTGPAAVARPPQSGGATTSPGTR